MVFRRIVIGIDFGEPSIAAARWIAELAERAELILVHVIDVPPEPRSTIPSPWDQEFVAEARHASVPRLYELAQFIAPERTRVEVHVGRPHDVLARVANSTGADLIVVGPHGGRVRLWKPLGTTAERLVRTAGIPVMVGTCVGSGPPRRLLVGVDDADPLEAMLALTRALIDTFEASATVLHVFSTAVMSHLLSMAQVNAPTPEAAQAVVEDRLTHERNRWLAIAEAHGMTRENVEIEVSHGDPGDVLLRHAHDRRADLIVIGREGSGRVVPLLLGRTVNTVIHGAQCPVLVVPPPDGGG